MRHASIIALAAAAAILAGCGERDQSLTASHSRPDGKPWQGANNPYVAKGWTVGDKAAWENQIRTRNQTQNESVKIN